MMKVAADAVSQGSLGILVAEMNAADLKPIQSDLSTYATEAALTGLFSQVAVEEMKIREDPKARVNSLLQSVFAQLDKK